MELYLAERFWPVADHAELEAAAGRQRSAASASSAAGNAVRYVGSLLVPSDEVVFSLFRAGTSAGVVAVNERAGVALDRVVGCRVVVARADRAARTGLNHETGASQGVDIRDSGGGRIRPDVHHSSGGLW